ncbi:M60 family metallopeptidase [Sphingobacterium spiritivorum]|uniref:M60 family metallopeptidase n=1 Tax=Sphingobacterium spiritivorum TaxID=258 RepID=UPI003DA294EC
MKKIVPLLLLIMGSYGTLQAQSAAKLKETYKELSIFSDPLATQLRKGIKSADIAKITDPQIRQVAEQLQSGKYDKNYRLASYHAILSPGELGEQLSIGDGYSKYQNITGIYLPIGKQTILVDGISHDNDIKLVIPNWDRHAPQGIDPTKDPKGWGIEKQEFDLRNGVNLINVKDFGGLAYITYFSDKPKEQMPIQVHFLNAAVNGYFDISKHNDQDWNNLVDHAVYPIVDAIGKHIQIAYPTEAIKKYAYGKGVQLISNYDSLVYRQHRILGLIKHNRVPENKILSRVNYNYYMFRDGDGVAYMGDKPGYAMAMVVDPASVIKGDPCWGFSHEVGHVHQTRPYLSWGGLGEVSNNIFSLYVTTSFGNKSRLSEQNNYDKVRNELYGKGKSYLQDGDVFNRLVPFWQLQLYFAGQGVNPDFYPDLFEAFRQQAAVDLTKNRRSRRSNFMDRGQNPAIYQLNFVKTVCEIGKVDLTEFFDGYGFFYVGKFEMDDYGKYNYEMTQAMVDECKAAIRNMNLPKPKTDLSLLRD